MSTYSTLAPLESFIADEGLNAQASYSSISLHRKCPQAWYYRHSMKLERAEETASPYLTIGRWWSLLKAVEFLERGRRAESLVQVPRKLQDKAEGYDLDPTAAVVSDVLLAAQTRWAAFSKDDQDEFVGKLGEPLPDRLAGMFKLWDAAHPDRHDRHLPLAAEMFWKRALPRPAGDTAWSIIDPAALNALPTMHLIGFIDSVYFDRERGMVVINDDKAPSDLGNRTSTLDDLMDSQLMLYAWGAAPALEHLGVQQPRAVSYDRVRSVAPSTPVVTATGALSKSVTAYDRETYIRWASEDQRPDAATVRAIEIERGMVEGGLQKVIDRMEPGRFWGSLGDFIASGPRKGLPKFGTYAFDPAVVEKLSQPSETGRWAADTFKPISGSLVRTHLRSAVDTALDIFQTQLRAEKTGEAARNLDRHGCARCDFADLCRAQLIGGADGEYDLEAFGLRKRDARRAQTRETVNEEATDD